MHSPGSLFAVVIARLLLSRRDPSQLMSVVLVGDGEEEGEGRGMVVKRGGW